MDTVDTLSIVIVMLGSFCVISCAVLAGLLHKIPSYQQRFRDMDDRKLVDTNVTAKIFRRTLLVAAFLAPALLLVFPIFRNAPEVQRFITCMAIVITLTCIAASQLFFQIFRTTQVEIEFRKFQKERNRATEPADRGGS